MVIAHELGLSFAQYGPVAQVLFVGLTPHRLLVLERFVVLVLVGGKAVLTQDELGQVEREAVGVLECEHIDTRDLGLAGFARFVHQFVEQTDTFVEGTEERLFLGLDDRRDLRLLCLQFRIGLTEVFDELRDELIEERATHVQERITVAYSTS